MNVDFRQRSLGEYAKMLKRRKWLILLPILTMTVAVGYVVYKLPSMYESTSLLTLKPPAISTMVIQSLSDEDLSQRLQTISQEVLSRSSLEPMVLKYKLFETERNAGMPMELIIEQMRKSINVKLEQTEGEKVAAFRVSYRDRSPEAARNVTAELASKFVNAQVLSATQRAETTREFIENQVNLAKTSLDGLEKQRLEIMMKNVETLPESSQGLIAQLTTLSSKRDSLIKEKETLILDRGRINDQIGANNRQINTIETLVSKDLQETARLASRFEDTPAYAQLIQKQTDLEASLKNLLTQYKEANPKVIEAKNNLAEVKKSLNDLSKNAQKKEDEAVSKGSRQTEIQKQGFIAENKRLQDNLARGEQQILLKEQEVIAVTNELNEINSKINLIPNVKVALESINQQYQSAKQTYDDFLKKKNSAELMVGVESNAQGETIRVQDAANLPSAPANASKKPMLVVLGAFLGLGIGLFLAGIFEIPRLFTIQSIQDAKHYTGLPVLASVPPLLSHNEIAWQKRARWFKILAGIAVAVGVIPLLIMALQASQIFNRVVS